jgi:hypothetical protein
MMDTRIAQSSLRFGDSFELRSQRWQFGLSIGHTALPATKLCG